MDNLPSLTKSLVFGSALLLLVACAATGPPFVPFPADVTPPRTVAVLALANQTDSDTAAHFLREEMYERLEIKGYAPTPLSDVDQLLADEFVPAADGEITRESISPIGRALAVDAVMIGALQRFGNKEGSVTEDEVEATFMLYETQTGDLLWEYHGHESSKDPTPWSPEAIGAKLGEAMMKTPHSYVVARYFQKLVAEMPNGAESDYEGRH